MTEIMFTVYGEAAPAGSKRGFYQGGRVIITDASKRSRPWKSAVTDAAIHAISDQSGAVMAPLDGPLRLELVFYVRRPRGHFGTGRNADKLKPAAPEYPTVKPDLLKLARAVEDALSGICYRDDAQIVTEVLSKRYTLEQPRVMVHVGTSLPVVIGV